MGWLSIFKPRSDAAAQAGKSGSADAVQLARVRARQRLIGAVVLVIIGIIGFPLVFETQPRPIPVDIPIEVPRKEGAPPLAMPAARLPVTEPSASAATPLAARGVVTSPAVIESREDAPVRSSAASAAASEPSATASKPAAAVAQAPTAKVAVAAPPAASAADGARAQALLEGKTEVAALSSGRFVVQVGAFLEASAANEARQKAERVGLKTYTQIATTAAGKRIRVRLGPFATREEADKAFAKARGAGLEAVVLTL